MVYWQDGERKTLCNGVWLLEGGETGDGRFFRPGASAARTIPERSCIVSNKICSVIVHLHLNRPHGTVILPYPKEPGKGHQPLCSMCQKSTSWKVSLTSKGGS